MTNFIPSDRSYKCPPGEVPLLIIDMRVQIHKWLKVAEAIGHNNFDLIWDVILNTCHRSVSRSIRKARIVVVDDCKTKDGFYWRQQWIDENLEDFPEYKGNRKKKKRPQVFYDLIHHGHDYMDDRGIALFRENGFEADDFTAAFAREKRKMNNKRHTFSVTVDNDHGQLVDDSINFYFYCCGGFRVPVSRIRREADFIRYYSEREKVTLEHPRFIVETKMRKGDRGDNLPKNSPRELIDLLDPPVLVPDEYLDDVRLEILNLEPNTDEKLGRMSALTLDDLTWGKL